MGGRVLVFPHDEVYDEGIAVGKLEAKREFAFELFGDGMSCEKVARYINESLDMAKQLEKSGRVSMIKERSVFK